MKILFIMLITVFVPVQATYAFAPSNMTDLSTMEGNMTGAAPSDFSDFFGTSDFTGNSTAKPSDVVDENCNTNDYESTACDIVHDLISLPAAQIRDYGLGDQSDFVIKQTLNNLDSGNLTKVLQNIPPEELSMIRDKLTPQTFNTTLLRVPEPQRGQIVDKLSLN
jgi:hypothetical protein